MRSSFLFAAAVLASQVNFAAPVSNKITGVGPQNSVTPYICFQDGNGAVATGCGIAGGATTDANQCSKNQYYAGATLRFGGCDAGNTYLGYLGFSVNNTPSYAVSTYSPPKGVHIAYKNPAIDSQGNITGQIVYTPISENKQLLSHEPAQNATWQFVGFNLSGLEFGKVIDPVVVPNLSVDDKDGNDSDLAEVTSLLNSGMNTVRVPVSWGYLQLEGPGKGDINDGYFDNYVKPLLETLTQAHVNAIVDLHAYMRYSQFGKEYSGCGVDGKCPDGTLITDPAVYQDIWKKLYAKIKADTEINQNYIMLDLMNEPVDVPNDAVFKLQHAMVNTLRNEGFSGTILVEGNAWTGLHSWGTTQDPHSNASLFLQENFDNNVLINVHQYLDSDYSGTHDQCVTDLTTQGPNGFNLDAFANFLKQNHRKAIVTEFGGGKDSASCSTALKAFMDYMKANAAGNTDAGFVGWTIWSVGHGWGDYNLRVTPASYHMQVLSQYLK